MGAPNSVEFAAKLRISEDFSSRVSIATNKPIGVFSFYSKDIQKWNERMKVNRERDMQRYKGIEVGPSINTVLKQFDAEAKGNTGLV